MRCYTVLLACGWLMLMAPDKPDGSFELHRPLRESRQIQFFDSSNDCYGALSQPWMQKYLALMSELIEKYKQQGMDDGTITERALKEASAAPELKKIKEKENVVRTATRCIPSDAINFSLK
jgi:hypothetical protein